MQLKTYQQTALEQLERWLDGTQESTAEKRKSG